MTKRGFDLPPKASPDVIAQRHELADAVCRELLRAGLPAYRGDADGGPYTGPGAEAHLDPLVGGAVFVDWNSSGELTRAAIDLFEKGIDPSDPPAVFRHYGTVHQNMRDALLAILRSAGFEAEEADPHTHGGAIRVSGFRH
ncbi:hypothetical protein C6Y14_32030 [Streptomyces dioscori]|uniref:Uncharacterized protein n=1 Tax=Streptomyces dioscori TaxID=2109333 RepID=A0A2P8PZR3_9ACTN|nr:hypothetical protein [Streptomyces dioscori]PSM39499.1 hypothetical protein C6Y14_32030 [Streptomyces dioscori]